MIPKQKVNPQAFDVEKRYAVLATGRTAAERLRVNAMTRPSFPCTFQYAVQPTESRS
jgi:hypothetical protein